MAAFKMNWRLYLMEALGLAIFMVSACFWGAMLEASYSPLHMALPNPLVRLLIMGVGMGLTAGFIFYSPYTSPSGSHINPAVTITFLRLGRINGNDAFFYIVFQFLGGTLAVLMMRMLMSRTLIDAPVNSLVTVPGYAGTPAAAFTEFCIAFCMMSMILFTTESELLKNYTRIIASLLVCVYVIIAGPVSGFGMNPARTLASALPAHIYTALWVYMLMPFAGMLGAAEMFLLITKSIQKSADRNK